MKHKIDRYVKDIAINHKLVARKLRLAQRQISNADTIEEYQQIGILIRDSWKEFTKSLFSPTLVPEGAIPPGVDDVKGMLAFVFSQWPNSSEKLRKHCEILLNLANEIQHRTSIDRISTEWCLSSSALAMTLLLELDSQSGKFAGRLYYRCPICGSLNVFVTKGYEHDFDGPGVEFENWECYECDWNHFIYLE